jgi:hypothetical protein
VSRGFALPSAPSFSGDTVGKSVGVSGQTGAPNPGRFVGVTAAVAPTAGTWSVGDYVVTQNGQMFVCVTAGTPGTWLNPRDLSNTVTIGEEVYQREFMTTASVPLTSGTMRLTYFTSRKSETTTQVRVYSGSTAAAATPTLCKVGLYLIDGSGVPNLVAATANDTAMFAATNTAYTRSWTTPYAKIVGQRYVLGVLVASATTMPTLSGHSFAVAPEPAGIAPILCGATGTNLTDLPATLPATPSSANVRPYAVMLP